MDSLADDLADDNVKCPDNDTLDVGTKNFTNENNAKAFNIGCESGVPSRTIKSLIDEVALFKTILAQKDIISIMNNGLEKALGAKSVSFKGKLPNTWASIKLNY
ncbi:MAG: hypothetical protein ACUVWN_01470 [bacterium]